MAMIRSASRVPCSLLLVVCVESAAAGVALVMGIWLADLFRNIPAIRTRVNIALLAYLWITFAGYLFTLPALCLAIYRQSPGLLIPYVVWRLLLILGSIALGVVLALLLQDANELAASRLPGFFSFPTNLRGSLHYWLPPLVLQCALGLLFLVLAFLALSRLNSRRSRLPKPVSGATLGASTRGAYYTTGGAAYPSANDYPYAAYAYTLSQPDPPRRTASRPSNAHAATHSRPKPRRSSSDAQHDSSHDHPHPASYALAAPQLYYPYYNYAQPTHWRY